MYKLCIELDGELHEDRVAQDSVRDRALGELGIVTLRFTVEFFKKSQLLVKEDIEYFLEFRRKRDRH